MKRLFPLAISLLLILAHSQSADAVVRLPNVLGDNMVLQRNQTVAIWGWDNPGQKVTVSLGEHSHSGVAGDDGKWRVDLPSMSAGGPHELTVDGSSTLKVKNLLIGEVWFCSGQSNMEWRVRQSDDAEEEIANANHPQIRHIKIPHRPADVPQQNVDTDGWEVCSPKTVADFTAVGYYFARHLQQELNVPIGLIGCNWGGTRIEPWTPPVGFQGNPALKSIADKLDEYPTRGDDGAINHQSPLALFNGMVHPVLPYTIRGAIWYQGESNRRDGMLYHEKMKALIDGWRQVWNKPDLPFYFVQLAPYRYDNATDLLPKIWEAQTATLSVPHTGMAVTVDIGDVDDIHPTNKQEVGRRLALWALAKTYGRENTVYSGPLYREMKIEDNKIRIYFDHVGSGLASPNGRLTWFTIAGEDMQFVEANARIDGNSVVVSASEIKKPKAVRFGWHQEAEPNLANREGLPASPFRAGEEVESKE